MVTIFAPLQGLVWRPVARRTISNSKAVIATTSRTALQKQSTLHMAVSFQGKHSYLWLCPHL